MEDIVINGNIGKSIVKFAMPCILARIIQNLYPLIDSLVVGKALDIESLSAIGISASLYALFNDTFIGLVSGFAIITSKKFGAGDKKGVNLTFYNSFIISSLLCLVVSVLGIVFAEQMLLLLKTPPELIPIAKKYIFVLFLGLLPNMLYNFTSEMLRAVGNSKIPLVLLVISTVIHLAVLYPFTNNYGVSGTAISLVLSYIVTITLGGIYICKKKKIFEFSLESLKLDINILKECFLIGFPMALTSFVVMIGVLLLNIVTNMIGTDYIAAYSVASKTGYVLTTPIFAFATAVSVFASQNYGAKNYRRIEKGVDFSLRLVMLINACILVLVFFAAKPFLRFMLNGNKTAVSAGFVYLCVRCVSTIVLTPAAIYKSLLPAIGKPFFSTLSGFLEIGVRFLFPLFFSKSLGFSVVPLTDTAAWVFIAILVVFAYYYEFSKLKHNIAKTG